MQRKNYTLKNSYKRFKNGMAMIMAIAVIVILATIMGLAISLTSETTKRTTDIYLYEQSVLLAKSAAEYALLRISLDNSPTDPCHVTTLNFSPDIDNDGITDFYDINISIKYSYTSYPSTTLCPDSVRFAPVTTPEQNGSVLLDIAVSVNDSTVSTEPIRYFRRTIQKL
jgi:type II secretory pathway pseudopilin PulG